MCVRALSNNRMVHSPKHIQHHSRTLLLRLRSISNKGAFAQQQHQQNQQQQQHKTNSDSNNNHNKKNGTNSNDEKKFSMIKEFISHNDKQTSRRTRTQGHIAYAQTQLESEGDAFTFTCLNKYVYIHKYTHTQRDNGWPHRTWNIVFAHNRHTPQLLHTMMQSNIAAAAFAAHSLLST